MHCRAQVVLAAVQSPLLDDRKRASLLIPRICNIILNAPNSCRHVDPPPPLLRLWLMPGGLSGRWTAKEHNSTLCGPFSRQAPHAGSDIS